LTARGLLLLTTAMMRPDSRALAMTSWTYGVGLGGRDRGYFKVGHFDFDADGHLVADGRS
jgi:hypothetical protein